MTATPPDTTARTTGFKRYVILLNPASTHAEMGRTRAAELTKRYGKRKVTVIETVKGGKKANQRLLAQYAELLGPDTLLCIVAGDGTVSMIISTLVLGEGLPPDAQQTVVLPLWGGNANDLAHMLNGASNNEPVDELLSQAHVVAIRPLVCTVTTASGAARTYIAAAYVSFGASAFTAKRLNSQSHRSHPLYKVPIGRLAAEFHTGLQALADTPTFRITEQGAQKVLYERTFANGPRFARISHFPIDLTEPFFYQHSVRNKRLSSIIKRLLRFIHMPPSAGRKTTEAAFTLEQPTTAQFDGEAVTLDAGSQITIRLHDESFYALSTLT